MTITTFAPEEFAARQDSAARFSGAAPAALRAEADALSSTEFFERYCPATGQIRLDHWAVATRCHGHAEYAATIEIGDRIRTIRAGAAGPVAAITSALYDEGFAVEILSFHQRRTPDGTATFVQCECEGRRGWAGAIAGDDTESAVRAMVASVNLLATIRN